ncbi:MAG: FG-GAP repeat protein, partial [Thermoplasmata archaeon]|nr:FG-GAP repeat protein [Thermoplasmata archaeon]
MDVNLSNADASFIGEAESDYSGDSVSGAGDVNNDGYDDVIIGSKGYNSYDGKAYLILGKQSGWTMDVDLSNADASYVGVGTARNCGKSVACAGDVNSDGYDDIIIGAPGDGAYLVLGKETGWSTDTPISNVDASFIQEGSADNAGHSVDGAGDVNGDGYDDIIVGAHYNHEGGTGAGQTYLIFGRRTGWSMSTSLADSNASFIGEHQDDRSGMAVAGAGDLNGDGYNDIMISAPQNDEAGDNSGEVYLIFGKPSGWTMDFNLENADISFIGAGVDYEYCGTGISGGGDVNGDGTEDILIGANGNDEGGDQAGQAYLLTGFGNTEPLEVYSIDTYSDTGYSIPVSVADVGGLIYVELIGLDGNESHQDAAIINVTFRPGS